MQVSKRFLALLDQQLAQFTDRPELRALVVYVASTEASGRPSLTAIGQWPSTLSLTSPALGPAARAPEQGRRWLALRDGSLLLGALRVEADCWPWPVSLRERLEATAGCLTEALKLDLEQQRLGQALAQRDDQLKLLVHQLRNPLAALRTFSQLLRRRLEGDGANRALVDNLLNEQRQINRYVEAIDHLADAPLLSSGSSALPLLLPPALNGAEPEPLQPVLEPLLQRAAATAQLQGRSWHPPRRAPQWRGDGSSVSEIVANLLENAFRYSRSGGAIGVHCQQSSAAGPLQLSVWDSGPAIAPQEREAIFAKGVRGSSGAPLPGSGLGLALARELAENLGGSLVLIVPPAALDPADPELPAEGNAFQLSLPSPTAAAHRSAAGSS